MSRRPRSLPTRTSRVACSPTPPARRRSSSSSSQRGAASWRSRRAASRRSMADLERREELLRDMRASVERLLRLGTKDLTEREVELQELGREFMEREARLSAEEAELNRRRSELGAVELKREAVEQRERALAAREEELAAAEASSPDPAASGGTTSRAERAPFRCWQASRSPFSSFPGRATGSWRSSTDRSQPERRSSSTGRTMSSRASVARRFQATPGRAPTWSAGAGLVRVGRELVDRRTLARPSRPTRSPRGGAPPASRETGRRRRRRR